MFAKNELANFYKTNFLLVKEHNFSLIDINNLIPFEHTIYVSILLKYLDDTIKEIKNRKKRSI